MLCHTFLDTSAIFLTYHSVAEIRTVPLLAFRIMEKAEASPGNSVRCNMNTTVDDALADDDEGWIRAGSDYRKKHRQKNKQHRILRCSSTQRPDGCRPPSGLTDIVDDDDLGTLRIKFFRKRDYFMHSHEGRLFITDLLASLDHAIQTVAPGCETQHSFDVLCLGLGNPAVDRASLNQLVVLDILLERDSRLTRSRTYLYDPLFRSVARTFILEQGMQVSNLILLQSKENIFDCACFSLLWFLLKEGPLINLTAGDLKKPKSDSNSFIRRCTCRAFRLLQVTLLRAGA